jgi:hypothetical protein
MTDPATFGSVLGSNLARSSATVQFPCLSASRIRKFIASRRAMM